MSFPESLTWTSSAPLVIAHRGASTLAPENTLAAFTRAADIGAHAVELDAKLTADGYIVVNHDLTLERTTDGKGKVAERTLSELKQLDAGIHYGTQFINERIPTLAEVFEAVGNRLLINVELTNYDTLFDRLVPAVIELVRKYGFEDRVLLSSFSPFALLQSRRLAGDIRTGLLVPSDLPRLGRILLKAVVPHDDLHPPDSLTTIDLLHAEHAAGRRVNVWTVNDQERVQELIGLGVDGIITDDPEMVLGEVNQAR
jgi:glycerophosphoryl diester phosphodiesterase